MASEAEVRELREDRQEKHEGGREFGHEHRTQASEAEENRGLADDTSNKIDAGVSKAG